MSRADDLTFLKEFCPHGGRCDDCVEQGTCTSLDYILTEARKPRVPPDPWGERIAAHRTAILAACGRLGVNPWLG